MDSHSAHERDEVHPLYLALFVIGGLCVGTGFLNLYWSFGFEQGDTGERIPLNQAFSLVGFTGLDNISLLPAADFSIPLVVVGLCCLVIANATAWKETDGY